jgi:hypothetical protein
MRRRRRCTVSGRTVNRPPGQAPARFRASARTGPSASFVRATGSQGQGRSDRRSNRRGWGGAAANLSPPVAPPQPHRSSAVGGFATAEARGAGIRVSPSRRAGSRRRPRRWQRRVLDRGSTIRAPWSSASQLPSSASPQGTQSFPQVLLGRARSLWVGPRRRATDQGAGLARPTECLERVTRRAVSAARRGGPALRRGAPGVGGHRHGCSPLPSDARRLPYRRFRGKREVGAVAAVGATGVSSRMSFLPIPFR